MKINVKIFVFLFCCTIMITGCGNNPNMSLINEDIGVQLPSKYKVIEKYSDFLGFDETTKYTFQYDEPSYLLLIKSIQSSKCYATKTSTDFKKLTLDEKLRIIDTIAQYKMTAFWVETDTSYFYNGGFLFINDPDEVIRVAAAKGVWLRNYEYQKSYSEFPRYFVSAIVNKRKRTLTYNFSGI